MAVIRSATGRILVPLAQQLFLSVTATVIATFIIAGVQNGSPAGHAAAPELTSGGKFAARIEAAADLRPDIPAAFTAPTIMPPLLVSQARTLPDSAVSPSPETQLVPRKTSDPAKTSRHTFRPDAKHRQGAEIARDMTPPKRADYILASAAMTPNLSGDGSAQMAESSGVWSGTRTAYRRVAGWTGTLLDHLVP